MLTDTDPRTMQWTGAVDRCAGWITGWARPWMVTDDDPINKIISIKLIKVVDRSVDRIKTVVCGL